MNNIEASLQEVLKLNGALAAAVVDWDSGMTLGMEASSGFNIELAAAGNAEVVKAKMATMKSLGLHGNIEDMLITLTSQIHIITMVPQYPELFMYVALESSKSNLALARNKMNSVVKSLSL